MAVGSGQGGLSPDLKMVSQASVCACHTLVLRRLCSSTGVTIIFPNVLIICKKHSSLNPTIFSLGQHSPWRGRVLTQTPSASLKGGHQRPPSLSLISKTIFVLRLIKRYLSHVWLYWEWNPRSPGCLKKASNTDIFCIPLILFFILKQSIIKLSSLCQPLLCSQNQLKTCNYLASGPHPSSCYGRPVPSPKQLLW